MWKHRQKPRALAERRKPKHPHWFLSREWATTRWPCPIPTLEEGRDMLWGAEGEDGGRWLSVTPSWIQL